MAMLCTEQGVIVRYPSDIFTMNLTQSKTDTFEGIPIITHYTGAMRGWQIYLKRLMDVVISSLGLLLLSPLFLLTTVAIKATSPGPVFFIQERVGLNKRRFRLYKFRTMVSEAEELQAELEAFNEVSGPVFKIKDDPRITRIDWKKGDVHEMLTFGNLRYKGSTDRRKAGARPKAPGERQENAKAGDRIQESGDRMKQ
jgi:hypothetical protein